MQGADCRFGIRDPICNPICNQQSELCNLMDLYVLLGLERGATLADVKRAYKRLARKYHPDINPGDRMAAAQFRQIAEAYETLSDAERRRRYDTTGSTAQNEGASTFGFEGFDFTISVHGTDAPTFGDLFADVLHHREARRGEGTPERGVDLHQAVTIELEEAIRGGQRNLTLTRQEACRTCQGVGRPDVSETRCLQCHGAGVVKSARGHMVFSRPCAQWDGTAAAIALSGLRRPAVRDADRIADDPRAAGPRRRRAHPRAGQGARRSQRRRDRRPVHHGACPAASALRAGRRRSAADRADRDPRSGAWREDRSAVARRAGAASRAARHTVGPALPGARTGRPVAARRRARRSRGRGAAAPPEAARGGGEGLAEGVRTHQHG